MNANHSVDGLSGQANYLPQDVHQHAWPANSLLPTAAEFSWPFTREHYMFHAFPELGLPCRISLGFIDLYDVVQGSDSFPDNLDLAFPRQGSPSGPRLSRHPHPHCPATHSLEAVASFLAAANDRGNSCSAGSNGSIIIVFQGRYRTLTLLKTMPVGLRHPPSLLSVPG